jgi:hypothetical protein
MGILTVSAEVAVFVAVGAAADTRSFVYKPHRVFYIAVAEVVYFWKLFSGNGEHTVIRVKLRAADEAALDAEGSTDGFSHACIEFVCGNVRGDVTHNSDTNRSADVADDGTGNFAEFIADGFGCDSRIVFEFEFGAFLKRVKEDAAGSCGLGYWSGGRFKNFRKLLQSCLGTDFSF